MEIRFRVLLGPIVLVDLVFVDVKLIYLVYKESKG